MPKIFSYVLGRPAALQTIEEIPAETPQEVAQEQPVTEEVVVNSSVLSDTPES